MKRINIKKIFTGKYKKVTFICIALLIVVGLSSILIYGTLSKYVNKTNYGHGMTTSTMTFISDKLGTTPVNNVVTSYYYEPISFTVSNGIDGVATDGDISYTGTCTVPTGYSCKFDTTNTNTMSDTITDNNTVQTKNYSITVTKTTGTSNEVQANVHIESTTPYIATLDGTFNIYIADDTPAPSALLLANRILTCEYSIINNAGIGKNVTVSIDTTQFLFDEGNEMFNSKTSTTESDGEYTSITSSINPYNSKNLVIFKKNSGTTCTINSITVS